MSIHIAQFGLHLAIHSADKIAEEIIVFVIMKHIKYILLKFNFY